MCEMFMDVLHRGDSGIFTAWAASADFLMPAKTRGLGNGANTWGYGEGNGEN